MKKNDKRILELRAQIDTKREAIGPARRFRPITHCNIEMNGTKYNLHTLVGGPLVHLLVDLNALRISADDLGIEDLSIAAYPIQDWITDLQARRTYLNTKAEQKRLTALEAQLERLLSDEKQTELAVDAIADLI